MFALRGKVKQEKHLHDKVFFWFKLIQRKIINQLFKINQNILFLTKILKLHW